MKNNSFYASVTMQVGYLNRKPSAKNCQTWNWHFATSREVAEEQIKKYARLNGWRLVSYEFYEK